MGSAAGAARGDWAGASVQSRYDNSYLQCMYANGNQIPVARGSVRPYLPRPAYAPPRRRRSAVPAASAAWTPAPAASRIAARFPGTG